MTDQLYSFRKVGVCGSSKGLSKRASELCQAIGRRLARESNLAIVSGGTKKRSSATGRDNFAAEWFVVSAAEAMIQPDRVDDRIITVAKDDDDETNARFKIGSTKRARGRTSEARRISFVLDLHALIAIGGNDGTRQELALALEFKIPILPVPGFGNAAQEVWDAYRTDLIKLLRIDDERARRWEQAAVDESVEIQPFVDEMIGALLASLPKRCFVIMPFHKNFDALYDLIIEPAIRAAGDEPIRVDRVAVPGNVTMQVENGLKACDYVIAVLDGMRPNVLYELGAAHAHGKPAILLNGEDGLAEPVPFDIYTQQRYQFSHLDAEFLARLTQMISTVSGSRRGS